MLQPLDEVTDKSKRPWGSYSIDELPERLAERIHDMPSWPDDLELVSRAKKALPFGTVPRGGVGYWYVPENEPVEEDVHGFRYLKGDISCLNYFEREGFLGAPRDRDPELRYGKVGRSTVGGGLGFHQTDIPGQGLRLIANRKALREIETTDPSQIFTHCRCFFASPYIEKVMGEAAWGMIDSIDVEIDPDGLKLPDTLNGRRFVDVLGRWQPYDLERSELLWGKFGDRFEIKQAGRVVLRKDIPDDLELFRPMHMFADVICRDQLLPKLRNNGDAEGFPFATPIKTFLNVKKADHPVPWWRQI